jgi:K+-transporting ATPase KdpF subunit
MVGHRYFACPLPRDLGVLLPGRSPEEHTMTAVEVVGLVLVIALGVYLLVALLQPEKFQ